MGNEGNNVEEHPGGTAPSRGGEEGNELGPVGIIMRTESRQIHIYEKTFVTEICKVKRDTGGNVCIS